MSMKETADVVKTIEVLGETILKAKADGKLNWTDVRFTAPLLAQARVAIEGAKKIPDEMREASPDEIRATYAQTLDSILVLLDAVMR